MLHRKRAFSGPWLLTKDALKELDEILEDCVTTILSAGAARSQALPTFSTTSTAGVLLRGP
jgi:hypothetical protein